MPRCVAFLRAVNVGGRVVKMAALRDEFQTLGAVNVDTFIASGNVIFETGARDLVALERKIELQLRAAFGFEIRTFIRREADLIAIASREPFDAADVATATTFVVGFLAGIPNAATRQTIEQLTSDTDRLQIVGRELYWLSRQQQNHSTFSNAVLERAIGGRTTFRGINTLRRLVSKLQAD